MMNHNRKQIEVFVIIMATFLLHKKEMLFCVCGGGGGWVGVSKMEWTNVEQDIWGLMF